MTARIGLVFLLVFSLCLPSFARKAGEDSSKLSSRELEERLIESPEEIAYVHGLKTRAKSGDKEAIPVLKRLHKQISRARTRREIAKVLLQLGEKDGAYWSEVSNAAKARIDSDMPSPIAYDGTGKAIRGKFSDEFLAWCKKKGLEPESLTEDALYRSQEDIRNLAETGDKRAIPLLIEALDNPNHIVAVKAVQGLAKFQHKAALDKILAVCEKAPAEVASAMGQFLVFFDDPRAITAAEKYVTNKVVLEQRKTQAATIGAKGIFEKF